VLFLVAIAEAAAASAEASSIIFSDAMLVLQVGFIIRKLTKCGHLEDRTLAVVSLILSLL
jgi:hypothetical protein